MTKPLTAQDCIDAKKIIQETPGSAPHIPDSAFRDMPEVKDLWHPGARRWIKKDGELTRFGREFYAAMRQRK